MYPAEGGTTITVMYICVYIQYNVCIASTVCKYTYVCVLAYLHNMKSINPYCAVRAYTSVPICIGGGMV